MATKKKAPLVDVSAMEPIPKPKTNPDHPNKKKPPVVIKNPKKPVAKLTDSAKKRIDPDTAAAVKAIDESIAAVEKVVNTKTPKEVKAAEKEFAKVSAKAVKAVEKVEAVANSKAAKTFEKRAKELTGGKKFTEAEVERMRSKPAPKKLRELTDAQAAAKLSSRVGDSGPVIKALPETEKAKSKKSEGHLLNGEEIGALNKIFKTASRKAAEAKPAPKPAKAAPKDVPDVRDLIRRSAKEAFK